MSNRIVSYIMDADMRLSHTGLRFLAIEQDPPVDLDALRPGEFVLFTNRAFTACKLFGANNTYVYHKNPNGNPMHPRALMAAVECFDGVKFDYTTALADEIRRKLSPELQAWCSKYKADKVQRHFEQRLIDAARREMTTSQVQH